MAKVNAVTDDNLDELQKLGDAILDRGLGEKSIGKNPSEFKSTWSLKRFKLLEINWSQTEVDDSHLTNSKPTNPRLFKSSSEEPLGMDSLTIIWYLTTFTALFGFFVVMACTEKSCNRRRDSKPEEIFPSRCPSYTNFAPPSYDTVMRKHNNQRVFIVPVHESNNSFNQTLSDNSPPSYQVTTIVDIEIGGVIKSDV